MKLKDNLILREVAGQYVVIPIGKRIQEIRGIVYMNPTGAFLWDYMRDNDFEIEGLVQQILKKWPKAVQSDVQQDVQKFVDEMIKYNLLDNVKGYGWGFIKVPVRHNVERNDE